MLEFWNMLPSNWGRYQCEPGFVVHGWRRRAKAIVIEFLQENLDPALPFHPKSISIGCTYFWWIIEVRGHANDGVVHHTEFRLPLSPHPGPRKILKWISAEAVRMCDGMGHEGGLIWDLQYLMPKQDITLDKLRQYSGLIEKQPAYDYSLPWR